MGPLPTTDSILTSRCNVDSTPESSERPPKYVGALGCFTVPEVSVSSPPSGDRQLFGRTRFDIGNVGLYIPFQSHRRQHTAVGGVPISDGPCDLAARWAGAWGGEKMRWRRLQAHRRRHRGSFLDVLRGGQRLSWPISDALADTRTHNLLGEATHRYLAGLDLPPVEWTQMVCSDGKAWLARASSRTTPVT